MGAARVAIRRRICDLIRQGAAQECLMSITTPATELPPVEPTLLNWEDFCARFAPVRNHLDANAPFDGLMFETYGAELAFIEQANVDRPLNVWTIVEDDDGELVVVDGMHWVNRFGFILTDVGREPGEYFVVADRG